MVLFGRELADMVEHIDYLWFVTWDWEVLQPKPSIRSTQESYPPALHMKHIHIAPYTSCPATSHLVASLALHGFHLRASQPTEEEMLAK